MPTSLLIVVVLFASAFIGGALVLYIKDRRNDLLKLTLSFSGAYLFAITILHLMPEVYASSGHEIGVWVLGGFLLQILMERFSEGIEHGHLHTHAHEEKTGRFPLGIMLSLCIHAFLEGVPLARGHEQQLLFGIALHHIPAAFALGSLLQNAGKKASQILYLVGVFAVMSPAGYLIGMLIGSNSFHYFNLLMAIVIGMFLHISTTILFESSSSDHHHFNRKKLLAVLSGMAIALASVGLHS